MVAAMEIVPRCPEQMMAEKKPFKTSTKERTDEVLKCVVEREIVADRWKSMKSAGKTESG